MQDHIKLLEVLTPIIIKYANVVNIDFNVGDKILEYHLHCGLCAIWQLAKSYGQSNIPIRLKWCDKETQSSGFLIKTESVVLYRDINCCYETVALTPKKDILDARQEVLFACHLSLQRMQIMEGALLIVLLGHGKKAMHHLLS